MQGRERGEGMSKSEMGLQSLGQGSQIRAQNGEGQAGSSMRSSENGTFVDGWYVVEGLRTSSGRGDAWIGVPVRCYTECNKYSDHFSGTEYAKNSLYILNIFPF